MKTTIIAGEWKSPNLGDEVICKTFMFLLAQRLPSDYNIRTLDISAVKLNCFQKTTHKLLKKLNHELSEKYYQLRRIKTVKKESKRLFKYNNVKKVFIPGGALFQKYFAESLKVLITECNKHNISVFFNACGYGSNDDQSKSIFKWIISQQCVKEITTRDSLSHLTKDNIKIVPDVAIGANLYYNFIQNMKNHPVVGINIIAPYYYQKCSQDSISTDTFNTQMVTMIKILSKNYNIKLFTNGDDLDNAYLNWLYDRVKDTTISIEPKPINGFELTRIISQFSLVVGFRLHSLIIAYSYNIPTIGFAWDEKLHYFGRMTGNKDIYFLSDTDMGEIISISEKALRTGINKEKKKDLSYQIIQQINSYI